MTKLCLALIFMLYSIAHAATTNDNESTPHSRRAVVVVRPPRPPTVVVRPGKRDQTSVAEMPPTSPVAEVKRAVFVARPPVVVVRRPPTVVIRPGKRDMSNLRNMNSPVAEFKRAAAKSVRSMKRDEHEMLSPVDESKQRRAVAVVRRPPVVVARPGKRDVSNVMDNFMQSPVQETKRAAVVVRRPPVVVARPGKRDVSNDMESPMQETKRAVAVVRRPPVVVARPGKRDVSDVMKMQSPVEESKRAAAVIRPRAVVVAARTGKRDLLVPEASLNVMRIVVSLVSGKIEWSYGLQQRIACNMKQRFGPLPEDLSIRLNDLHVLEAFEKSVEFLSLLSIKSSFENKFTFLDPLSKEPVLWSIFSKDIAGKLGFFIQDEVCFKAIVSAVKDFKDSPVEFFLL